MYYVRFSWSKDSADCTRLCDCVAVEYQRDPLDEQFDELFKDVSEELREKIDMELAADGDADYDNDNDVLVVEYVSDDENLVSADKANPDSEIDEECDHVLKARQWHVTSTQFTVVISTSVINFSFISFLYHEHKAFHQSSIKFHSSHVQMFELNVCSYIRHQWLSV